MSLPIFPLFGCYYLNCWLWELCTTVGLHAQMENKNLMTGWHETCKTCVTRFCLDHNYKVNPTPCSGLCLKIVLTFTEHEFWHTGPPWMMSGSWDWPREKLSAVTDGERPHALLHHQTAIPTSSRLRNATTRTQAFINITALTRPHFQHYTKSIFFSQT